MPTLGVEYRFRVRRSVQLGGYAGGGWRGAFGHSFLPALCATNAANCLAKRCSDPKDCSYYSLFERDRNQQGENIPKPYVLGIPLDPSLFQLVRDLSVGSSASVVPPQLPEPFRLQATQVLERTGPVFYGVGELVRVRLLWLGATTAVEPAVTQHLRLHGLACGGGQLELEGVDWSR